MAKEQTLVFVKPDAVARGYTGRILARFEAEGLKIVALRMVRLTLAEAQRFYQVHAGRPFFDSLTRYVSSGPVVAVVLEGEAAVSKVRELMGATDPKEAAPGTIRAEFGQNKEQNAVHGSDSAESAAFEIPFFFSRLQLLEYERV